jgi:kinesin family member C2/C3
VWKLNFFHLWFPHLLQVSLMEIYNETIRDLVEPKDETGEDKKLDVKLSPDGGTHVPGLVVAAVRGMDDVVAVLKTGERNRSVGKTNMNEHSSRSHMILSVYTRGTNELTGARALGKLHLIDLAGSERVGKSGAEVGQPPPPPPSTILIALYHVIW